MDQAGSIFTLGLNQAADRHALRTVRILRNISIAGQALTFSIAGWVWQLELPASTLLVGMGLQGLIGQVAGGRLRRLRPAGEPEWTALVLSDLLVLLWMGYRLVAGPVPLAGVFLVPYFLFPLSLAANFLPPPRLWPLGALVAACCGWLIVAALPQPDRPAGGPGLGLTLSGLGLATLLAAGLICFCVGSLALRLRQRERSLAEAQRREQDNECLLRVGSLAAGAAHQFGTPLNTIAVVADELSRMGTIDPAELGQGLRIIADQIAACRRTMADLACCSQEALAGAAEYVRADRFVDELASGWLALRPGVTLVRRGGGATPPLLLADKRLAQGLTNLLDNAADASPDHVELSCEWHDGQALICIADRGSGMPGTLAEGELPPPGRTTKGERGTGLGLLLARTAIARAGGSLTLSAGAQGGTCARVRLPAHGTVPERGKGEQGCLAGHSADAADPPVAS